nr:MAG TPA: Sex factor F TraW protein N terminal [Caudoviricetes sp.]
MSKRQDHFNPQEFYQNFTYELSPPRSSRHSKNLGRVGRSYEIFTSRTLVLYSYKWVCPAVKHV